MHRLPVLALALLLTAAATPSVTTVILVRHAEKAGTQGDVPLSAVGEARAKELARVLSGTKLTAIYTTPYKRTRDTAAPVAAAQGLTPIDVAAGKTYPADVVAKIGAGETVLIVGHSNTTPDVLRQLGIADPPPIADSQHDDLFIVTTAPGMAPRLVALRYGAASR
jgi:phosphohistidine phosphatase SixA